MTDAMVRPTIYLKAGRPFCLKVRLFLLESGQLVHVDLRAFVPRGEERKRQRSAISSRPRSRR
ncbi:glutathione S-transferase N-terminal domain-containing protein [Methylobacterium sp. 10]|uniref:glutathione S-transferase N-terminal domain-containing protein n=1 Tax=Methylobacterium sp. 10 TaxID=1101191 RepID=UPI0004BAB805|nr:glutathione S-transferase N-terminal domain-containing protein [Methylobacterium sp. 10]